MIPDQILLIRNWIGSCQVLRLFDRLKSHRERGLFDDDYMIGLSQCHGTNRFGRRLFFFHLYYDFSLSLFDLGDFDLITSRFALSHKDSDHHLSFKVNLRTFWRWKSETMHLFPNFSPLIFSFYYQSFWLGVATMASLPLLSTLISTPVSAIALERPKTFPPSKNPAKMITEIIALIIIVLSRLRAESLSDAQARVKALPTAGRRTAKGVQARSRYPLNSSLLP